MREICTIVAYVSILFIMIYPLYIRVKWKDDTRCDESKLIKSIIFWITGIVICLVSVIILFVTMFV